jgi:hypothetical protein
MVNHIETKKKPKLIGRQKAIDEHGELHEIVVLAAPEEVDKNFVKVFHAFTQKLVENPKIAGKSIRLLFWIMSELETGKTEFYMHYSIIKEELGVSKATYHSWVRTLIEEGIIRKASPNLYQINPACVIRGKGHSLLEEFNSQKDQENQKAN